MAKNKFLLLSLEDDSAKKIANTINNESARKILDYLADKDATESDIVKDLKIPASTVNYNIEQLLNAKLITWEKYHYSEKGKEVRHYSVANKFIIIAPKGDKEGLLELLKKLSPAFLITLFGAGLIEYYTRIKTASLEDASLMMATSAPVQNGMMAKSAALAPETANYANDIVVQSTPLLSEPTIYFILGSVVTLMFVFLYLYLRTRIKK